MKITQFPRRAAVAALVSLPVVCFAQPAVPKAVEHETLVELATADMGLAAGLAGMHELTRSFASNEVGGRVIKGAPYAATAVSETVQTLADGNRIVRKSETRLARDAEGRTRQERADGSVFISDPVAGKTWLLRTKSKSAIELPRAMRLAETPGAAPLPPLPPVPPLPPGAGAPRAPVAPQPPSPAPNASAEEMRSWAESMRAWARDFAARFRGEDVQVHKELSRDGVRSESRVVTVRGPHVDVQTESGPDGSVTREIRVVSVGDGAPMAWSHSGGAFGFGVAPGTPFPLMAPLGPGATTALGSREFDGVRADGSRTSWTIAAGKIGNEKPIEIFSERWHAPDLMLVVQTRYVDPRTGENSYRLTNLKRGEPDAALFKLPADYELRSRAEERRQERDLREKK